MSNRFEQVQQAAQARKQQAVDSEAMARQIVTAAGGDMRLVYEFLDTLTNHVSRMLREGKR